MLDNQISLMEQVLSLAKECDYEEKHSHQVTKLALRLFDELRPLHQLGEPHRFLLQSASLLHDIGWIHGQKDHHKASRDLILESPLIQLPLNDKMIVALIARYHRGSLPEDTHKHYDRLVPSDRLIVRKLASLLRIADGLDRRHVSSVKEVTCSIESLKVVIRVNSDQFYDMEKEAAKEKAGLFEQVFGKEVVIEWKKG